MKSAYSIFESQMHGERKRLPQQPATKSADPIKSHLSREALQNFQDKLTESGLNQQDAAASPTEHQLNLSDVMKSVR